MKFLKDTILAKNTFYSTPFGVFKHFPAKAQAGRCVAQIIPGWSPAGKGFWPVAKDYRLKVDRPKREPGVPIFRIRFSS
jgi:hypothetical protein